MWFKVGIHDFLDLKLCALDSFWCYTDINNVHSWSYRSPAASRAWETFTSLYINILLYSTVSRASNWISTHWSCERAPWLILHIHEDITGGSKDKKERGEQNEKVNISLVFTVWRELREETGFKTDEELTIIRGRLKSAKVQTLMGTNKL